MWTPDEWDFINKFQKEIETWKNPEGLLGSFGYYRRAAVTLKTGISVSADLGLPPKFVSNHSNEVLKLGIYSLGKIIVSLAYVEGLDFGIQPVRVTEDFGGGIEMDFEIILKVPGWIGPFVLWEENLSATKYSFNSQINSKIKHFFSLMDRVEIGDKLIEKGSFIIYNNNKPI